MIIIAYIDETIFEHLYKHRDASVDPTSTSFTQWIKTYSAQINTYLGVTSDICAYGDGSTQSETIIDVIGELLEAHFNYRDLWRRTPEPERANLTKPHLNMTRYTHLRMMLEEVKGMDESIETPAFNFLLDRTSGGYEY